MFIENAQNQNATSLIHAKQYFIGKVDWLIDLMLFNVVSEIYRPFTWYQTKVIIHVYVWMRAGYFVICFLKSKRFYSARALKHHAADRHDTPLDHIILTPSQLVKPIGKLNVVRCDIRRVS